jgi:hypothetical protein
LRAEFSLRSDFKCRIHNHPAISGRKTALPVDREVCVSSSGRIRELRFYKYYQKLPKTQNFISDFISELMTGMDG